MNHVWDAYRATLPFSAFLLMLDSFSYQECCKCGKYYFTVSCTLRSFFFVLHLCVKCKVWSKWIQRRFFFFFLHSCVKCKVEMDPKEVVLFFLHLCVDVRWGWIGVKGGCSFLFCVRYGWNGAKGGCSFFCIVCRCKVRLNWSQRRLFFFFLCKVRMKWSQRRLFFFLLLCEVR